MKSFVGGTTLAFGLIALLASACGDDDAGSSKSPVQACNDFAVAMCAQIYKCLTPDIIALAGFPATESACVSEQKAAEGCDSKTAENACTGSEKYHGDQASKCVDQVKAASCSQILANGENTAVYAPACDMVCTVG